MTSRRPLVLATRRSALALAQSRAFVRQLTERWPDLEVQELLVTTTGDRITDVPLANVGGKGLFIKEIEQALLERRADFAVHSLKDVPAVLAPEFCLACIPVRADARDVLVRPAARPTSTIRALPRGARIGTSSLRRAVQLVGLRPDLVVAPLRGNVDTRLRKVDAGEVDAIVLARAGLVRLGLAERAMEILEPETMIPAPGQGSIAVECRTDDAETRALLGALADTDSWTAVACERGLMRALGADCKVPFGAHARKIRQEMSITAFYASGARFERVSHCAHTCAWPESVAAAEALGVDLGHRLLSP